ncbi:low molecular weight phosphatase family protein [Cognatishimia activa]|uniref:Low molecular weight phosphatase family protein n=1 Tax=Cognatishimia activa TaxID=1715691 RepID=A0A975I6E4_9RHOB|nr:low molecular weight phosphatase family protein [Cognatishimia activa]QTN34824.1 low molecular weight phosphatase family protein [Cognatishimia activa]
MTQELPQSVLFCCDHNAVRSPMAEGIMKQLFGMETYVQSAGLKNDLEIDGFAITVCHEIDVELARHQSRSFEEMEQFGDQLSSFDMIIALSPASYARAKELTKLFHLDVLFWDTSDPTSTGETRESKLDAYRKTRDEIIAQLKAQWGSA